MRRSITTVLAAALLASPACTVTSKLGLPGSKSKSTSPERRSAGPGKIPKDERVYGEDVPDREIPEAEPESPGADLRAHFVDFKPRRGQPVVKPLRPPWCAIAEKYDNEQNPANWLGRALESEFWTDEHLAKIGMLLCTNPDDGVYQAQTAAFIQEWMNTTGLAEKDATDSLTARMDNAKWKAMGEETCKRFPRPTDEVVGGDREFALARREIFGCGGASVTYDKFFYFYDRRTTPPDELLRAYHPIACYGTSITKDNVGDHTLRQFIGCHPDVTRAKRSALDAELKTGKYNAHAVSLARETFARGQVLDAIVGEALDEKIASDPAYKEIYLEAPKRGWDAWSEAYDANEAGYEAAYAMEDALTANSRKEARACGDNVRKGLAAQMARSGAKDLEAAKRALGDATGKALLGAVIGCAAAHIQHVEADALLEVWREGQPARGPRRAALLAAAEALGDVLADRPRFPLGAQALAAANETFISDRVGELLKDAPPHGGMGFAHPAPSAIVKSVEKKGDEVLVSFRTESFSQTVYSCKDTKKIWRIQGGQVIYHRSCKITGSETVKKTEGAILVAGYAATAIKPGVLVEFAAANSAFFEKAPRPAYPLAVYKDGSKGELLAAYGYAVK